MASSEDEDASMENAVYLLKLERPGKNMTYLGSTNDFKRRFRQHNGEISGGAKTTKRLSLSHQYKWRTICVVRGFKTRAQAYSFEIRAKHITLSLGKDTLANNANAKTSKGVKVHNRVRKMIIMCNLPRWSRKCPPAEGVPLRFEWHAPEFKPLVEGVKYLPSYVNEVVVS